MADVRPQSSQDPDLELGNQEPALTSPTIAQNIRDEEARARQYFLEEEARACAAWSSLDLFPRKYLLLGPNLFEGWQSSNSSYQGSLSESGSFAEPDSCSGFDSPSLPPHPSDLEALNKTWEQVKAHNTMCLKSVPGHKPSFHIMTDFFIQSASALSSNLKALYEAQEKRKVRRDKAQENRRIYRDRVKVSS